MDKPCPCKDCVAPKRYPGCHAVCKEYIDWHNDRQDKLAAIYNMHKEENDCFPNKYRNGKSIKKRMRR